MVLGGHGDQMVPVVSATTVGGVPLRKLVAGGPDPGDGRADRRRAAASSSTCSAPPPGTPPAPRLRRWSTRSSSTRSASCPAPAYLEGEYGIDGLYMGVPVELGSKGVERMVELDLDEPSRQALAGSADAVREVVSVLTT